MIYLAIIWLVIIIRLWRREETGPALSARLPLLLGLGLVATGTVATLHFLLPIAGKMLAFPIDDSYITLTAARNFAQHNLFAINPDAPVAGITSPLHVLLVGTVGKLLTVVIASRLLGAIAYLAAVIGTLVWTRSLGARWATATAAAVMAALSGPLVFGALNGLETALFAAWVVWSFAFFEWGRERPKWLLAGGLAVGLAILTRPEGYFLGFALFGVETVIALRRREWRRLAILAGAGATAAVVVAPYWLVNLVVTGHVMPLTVSAKKNFFAAACTPIPMRLFTVVTAPLLLLGPLILFAPLALWARGWLRRGYPLVFLAVFYLGYLVQFPGALGHYWGRYQHPLLPVVFPGIALGAAALVTRWRGAEFAKGKKRAIMLALALLLGAGAAGSLNRDVYRNALETVSEGGYLRQVVDWVRDNTEPGDLVAAHDIGVLTFFGDRRVLDLVGLTDPEIAAMYATTPPLCRDFSARGTALLKIFAQRRPKIVYFMPDWDTRYMGLRFLDADRHLKYAHTMRKMMGAPGREIQMHQYDFFRAEWENEIPAEKPSSSAAPVPKG